MKHPNEAHAFRCGSFGQMTALAFVVDLVNAETMNCLSFSPSAAVTEDHVRRGVVRVSRIPDFHVRPLTSVGFAALALAPSGTPSGLWARNAVVSVQAP